MRTTTPKRTLSLFWQYTRKYNGQFVFAVVGAILGVILQDIIPPYVVSRIFSLLQSANLAGNSVAFHDLQPLIIVFVISLILAFVFWRLQSYAVWLFEIKAERDIHIDIFDNLTRQSARFHADRFGGALVSQTNRFVGAYERLMDDFIWSILPGLTTFIASLGVLFVVAPKFAWVLLGIVLVYIIIMGRQTLHQFPFNKRQAEGETQRTAALADAITNTNTVRAFAGESYETNKFSKVAQDAYIAYHELAVETFKNDSLSHGMTNFLRIVALVFGVYAITNLQMNAGILFLVISYSAAVVDRLWTFGRIVRNVNRAFGDATEMTEILGLEPDIKNPVAPEKVRIRRGRIQFKNVVFNYPDAGKKESLFDNLNLTIKPGEKVGLVGHSGGGKTTITRLLLRFNDVQGGHILVDNQDIIRIKQEDLRSHIAYVPQEPVLFHRSLLENIRYGKVEASIQEVRAVAKMAYADEFIDRLPDGYDTLVGERGVKLSGGQRQRIAIARAMLKHAPILALDEATSALDSESESLIQSALWRLMENRTAIVIAHRLSTVQKMDRIIVLHHGAIAEEGTHKELLQRAGIYAELWSHQSGGFIPD